MKKLLLVLGILFGMAFTCYAQTEQQHPALLSLGADVGIPVGPTAQTFSSTTGISFKFEFPFPTRGLSFTLGAAFSNYSVKNTSLTTDTLQNGHFIPIEAGLKYYIYHNIYFEGDIGESLNINQNYMGYQSAFMYSPVVGVSLPVKQNTAAIDLSLRYESRIESAGNINQVALRIAYKFSL